MRTSVFYKLAIFLIGAPLTLCPWEFSFRLDISEGSMQLLTRCSTPGWLSIQFISWDGWWKQIIMHLGAIKFLFASYMAISIKASKETAPLLKLIMMESIEIVTWLLVGPSTAPSEALSICQSFQPASWWLQRPFWPHSPPLTIFS